MMIGLMSGTSLDGLDIVHAQLNFHNNTWKHKLLHCETIDYTSDFQQKLKNAHQLSGLELTYLNKEIGEYFAQSVNNFCEKNAINKGDIDAIASHGHTIFHQPEKGMTLQIGCGQTIAVQTGIKTINNFREKDVLLGGQGAPLVPVGDALLLKGEADAFLNLGGFANISLPEQNNLAFDICPANIVLNAIMSEQNQRYDKDGQTGRKATVNTELLKQLNALKFYGKPAPKSLGLEWVEKEIYPLLKSFSFQEKLGTFYAHIAHQIAQTLEKHNATSVMITGGGAKNSFLMTKIKEKYSGNIKLPNSDMIDFKEALIFAFLGVLNLRNENNCLAQVTGAKADSKGGNTYEP